LSKAVSKLIIISLVCLLALPIVATLPTVNADGHLFNFYAIDGTEGVEVAVPVYVNGTLIGTTPRSCDYLGDYRPYDTVVLTANETDSYGNYLKGFEVNGVLILGNSTTQTYQSVFGKTVYAYYEFFDPAANLNYTFNGLNDEITGQYTGKVTVTANYLNRTSETFTVNGSYTYQTSAVPLYFSYALSNNITREYWLQPDETGGTYNIFDNTVDLSTIVFQIRALGGVGLSSYLSVQRLVNGSYQVIEQRKVDANGIATMYLQAYTIYRVIAISENTSVTFGNINTYTSAITLTLSALSFPSDVLMQYKHLRIWASRPSSTEIQICYEDTNLQTVSVSYQIAYANGTVAYSAIHTGENSFIDVWSAADSNTTYYLTANVSQSTFGYSTFAQVLLRDGASTSPIDLSFLGDWPIDPTQIFWAFIVFIMFGVGSVLNAYIGGFAGVATAAILVWLGWLVIPLGAIVAAFCVVCMVGIVHWKRRS
jgi:hypothetical protein